VHSCPALQVGVVVVESNRPLRLGLTRQHVLSRSIAVHTVLIRIVSILQRPFVKHVATFPHCILRSVFTRHSETFAISCFWPSLFTRY